jgi:8-oxo-dGTP pyrophosphatase MutT (NUDIX family)
VGAAPRSRVRAKNLRHACVVVVVRDESGRIYVHRRAESKDLYPGCYDVMAGGVLQAGEEPLACARREVEEELGVTGVELIPIGEADYADEHATYHAFGYVVTYSGPIRWQPEEVVWGDWVTFEQLASMLADPAREFAPDTRTLLDVWQRVIWLPEATASTRPRRDTEDGHDDLHR